MSVPLLTTKLYVPPVRPEWVPRPRLVDRLIAGMDRKLTLLSAPAGYGKTTLLSECATRCGRPVAWLTLDTGDNDPVRFWTYFVAALQTVQDQVGRALLDALPAPELGLEGPTLAGDLPRFEAPLTTLLNEAAAIPGPLALILDDFHLLEAQPVLDSLAFLLERQPPQVHLVIATRSDPVLPLSRLRGRGEMSELRTADLRFSEEEAAAFLNEVTGLQLSAEDAAALEARTEGWVAGLQMAGLSMRGREAGRVSEFITGFTGSHRFVLDYLTDEVLLRQPPDIRRFLLETSILDRLSAPLCDYVTGQEDGRDVLAWLDAANLFVVPLDDQRRWYRYHRLFADLLRSRLEETDPDQLPVLHLGASEWYEANGLLPEAVHHAFSAGDVERVARLADGHALHMLEHGALATLRGWLDTLPDDVVRSHPWLCIGLAWASGLAGQLDAVEPLLHDASKALAGWEHAIPEPVPGYAERQHARAHGHIAAVRAAAAIIRGDMLPSAELAREALELLPPDDMMARSWAAMVLGLTIYHGSDLAAADQALSEAATAGQRSGKGHVAVLALCNLAALQMDRGQLHTAEKTLRNALRFAGEYADRTGRHLRGTDLAHTYLGVLLCQWNRLEAALGHLRDGTELAERRGEPLRLATAYLHLAALLQTMGDAAGALSVIGKAKQAAASSLSPWIAARVATAEAWVRLKQGDTAAASRWASTDEERAGDYDACAYWSACLLKARILVARGELAEASGLLVEVSDAAEAAGGNHYLIASWVLQAIILQAQGRLDQALTALEPALSLAGPEGYVRIFIDEGEPLAQLLREAAARGIAVEYAGRLLEAWAEETTRRGQQMQLPLSNHLVEPLSERELQVLRLTAAGLSNREIGEQLFLAVGTVKKYTSTIYGKLGVHSRTQAVARARDLGLL
jgi:LuxR family maltose regulon positive regulatory protein